LGEPLPGYSVLLANTLFTVTTQFPDRETKVKVKVKFTLEQATKTQRGIRGITLLFL
jgi:hypothetical protein